jgi:hypothetical protein
MRNEYESLITQIRQEYQQQKNDLRAHLKRAEMESETKKREYNDLKGEFEGRIINLQKEMERMER